MTTHRIQSHFTDKSLLELNFEPPRPLISFDDQQPRNVEMFGLFSKSEPVEYIFNYQSNINTHIGGGIFQRKMTLSSDFKARIAARKIGRELMEEFQADMTIH